MQQSLGHIFIHTDGAAQHIRANEGYPVKFQEALQGAVFAGGAVDDGKNDVESRQHFICLEASDCRFTLIRGDEHGFGLLKIITPRQINSPLRVGRIVVPVPGLIHAQQEWSERRCIDGVVNIVG